MKNERRFLERMSEIDDELITRADNSVAANNKRNFHKRLVIIAAAILAVCAVSATAATFYIKNKNQHFDTSEDVIHVPISDVFWVDKREKNKRVVYDL